MAKKSEVLYIRREEGNVRSEDMQLRGRTMKKNEKITYLRSVFAGDRNLMQDIERRRAGATPAFGTLRRRYVGKEGSQFEGEDECFV